MTEEIQFLDDEMRDVLAQVQKGIEELMSPGAKKLSFDARAEKVANVQQRLDRAKKLNQSFRVEQPKHHQARRRPSIRQIRVGERRPARRQGGAQATRP